MSPIERSAGGGGASAGGLVLLFNSTLGADAASIDTGANGVAGGHAHLSIFILARGTSVGNSVQSLVLRFNNDAGPNYDYLWSRNVAGVIGSVSGFAATQAGVGQMAGAAATANYFSPVTITVPSYDQTVAYKTANTLTGPAEDALASSNSVFGTLTWRSTAAITRISIFPADGSNMLAGSRMTIYGTQ